MTPSRAQRRALDAENLQWPAALKKIPRENWPASLLPVRQQPFEVWRSRGFLVQIFNGPNAIERLSVIRTSHNGKSWEENISWDELQRLKSECGRGHRDAVEVYPEDGDVVNVANMRHLWVLPMPLPFAWRKL